MNDSLSVKFLGIITLAFLRGLLSTDIIPIDRCLLHPFFSFFVILMLSADLLFGLSSRIASIIIFSILDTSFWEAFRMNDSLFIVSLVLLGVVFRSMIFFPVDVSCSK